MTLQKNVVTSVTAWAGLIGLTAGLQAQSLLTTQGQVIAAEGNQVPGFPFGVTFGGVSAFENPCVDDLGNVLFRARILDTAGVLVPSLGNTNDRGYFYGPTEAGLTMVYRNGDAAPGIAGATLNAASSGGLSASPRAIPNGNVYFGATVSGGSVTASNDAVIYGGPIGGVQIVLRENDFAPSGGATMPSVFGSGTGYQGVGMNRNNRFVFKSTLTGGDVVGSTNNDAVITGTPGFAPEWVVRKGDAGPGGTVISGLGGFLQQMNDAGQIVHDVTLSQTLGTPATAANDRVLYVYTPGSGNTAVLREGEAAPGTAGATFNVAGDFWGVNMPPSGFNQNGQAMLHADLLNGDVVAGVNDRAVYLVSTSGKTLGVRKGDAAPGTDGTFGTWNNTNAGLNNSGAFTIASTITGGTTNATNDSGIWSGTPGNLQLVVREGDILPGTVGTEMIGAFGSFGSLGVMMNDQGSVLFDTDLQNGDAVPDVNSRALCAWSPGTGVRVVVRQGDMLEVSPGTFKAISTWGSLQFNNTDCSPLSFSPNGVLGLRLNHEDSTSTIVKIDVPVQPGNAYCSGDGSAAACPCGNSGSANHGCASSLFGSGAKLSVVGAASLGGDTLVLIGSNMPNSSVLYFQGTTRQSAGMGTAFGDGLRCAGGTITRLKTVTNVGGGSQYPQLGDLPVSVRGLVATPGLRVYQAWYRNAATFCTSATFNLTNGWSLTWTL